MRHTHKLKMLALAGSLSLFSLACAGGVEVLDDGESEESGELVEIDDDELPDELDWSAPVSDEETFGVRACTQDNDCRTTSCYCHANGYCEVRLIGPQPPAGTCDLPPTRSCSSASDCRGGCSCIGGKCSAAGAGPLNPSCHLPPPDSYEYDDKWSDWTPYSGPQRHSFHYAGDRDFVAVYISEPGTVRFRTHSLANQADTRLKVFAFDNHIKGELLGEHDDIGGWYFWADSKSSRIDLQVPANSLYLIKIIDDSPPNVYTDSLQFPEYTLELSYL